MSAFSCRAICCKALTRRVAPSLPAGNKDRHRMSRASTCRPSPTAIRFSGPTCPSSSAPRTSRRFSTCSVFVPTGDFDAGQAGARVRGGSFRGDDRHAPWPSASTPATPTQSSSALKALGVGPGDEGSPRPRPRPAAGAGATASCACWTCPARSCAPAGLLAGRVARRGR